MPNLADADGETVWSTYLGDTTSASYYRHPPGATRGNYALHPATPLLVRRQRLTIREQAPDGRWTSKLPTQRGRR